LVALTVGVATTPNVELTATVEEGDDVRVTGENALSVTLSSNAYVPPAIRVFAAIEHVAAAPTAAPLPLLMAQLVAATYGRPFTDTSHCQE